MNADIQSPGNWVAPCTTALRYDQMLILRSPTCILTVQPYVETEPEAQPGVCYVAGIDVGGEERDSTVLTIHTGCE